MDNSTVNHTEDDGTMTQINDTDTTAQDISIPPHDSDDGSDSAGEKESGDDEEYDSSEDENKGYPLWAGGAPRAPVKKTVVGKGQKPVSKTASSDKDKDKKDKDKKDDKDKKTGSDSKKIGQPVAGK